MGSPTFHAKQSAKRFGGKPADYIEIHDQLDSSKKAMSDLRHRALTHNSWFVTEILEKIFGRTITNSEGNKIAVRDIAQWHIMEDFGGSFPSAQDYLMNLEPQDWMDNGKNDARPPSHTRLKPVDMSKFPESFPSKIMRKGKETAKKIRKKDKMPIVFPEFPLPDLKSDIEPPRRSCGGQTGQMVFD